MSSQHDWIENSISNLSTAQATGNFTTLNSINGLGRDVTAQANQNALQQLNSFNILNTSTLQGFNALSGLTQTGFNTSNIATLTGFNSTAMQIQNSTNQIIAQWVANAAAMATCCCDILEKIGSDGDTTRALITNNRMSDLQDELAQARLDASQQAQTNSILTQIRNPATVVV